MLNRRKINRREFLAGSAMAAAAIGLGIGEINHFYKKKKHRYLVATESTYWRLPQDFSGFEFEKILDLPVALRLDGSNNFTVLTSVNEDGSDLRRIKVPGKFHCATHDPVSGLVYLIANHNPSLMVALDPRSLELANVWKYTEPGDGRVFGGHGFKVPGADLMAFSMIGMERKGAFDYISFRNPKTLKEEQRFSSYGFHLHEIRLSPDRKYIVCGHYGSNLDGGPYQGLSTYGAVRKANPDGTTADHLEYYQRNEFYPASVTFVDVASGQRLGIFSRREVMQYGHATCDDRQNAYTPGPSPKIPLIADFVSSNHFAEGPAHPFQPGELAYGQGAGISLDFDQKFREVIVPARPNPKIYLTNADTGQDRIVDYAPQLQDPQFSWVKLGWEAIGGMQFHPDGKHFILSAREGILAFERGTYKLNPEKSFPLKLEMHSHLCIV